MVTITQATLQNTLPLFIAKVLSNNITDPESANRGSDPFVFKDPPEKIQDLFPYIIVEMDSYNEERPTHYGELRIPQDFLVVVRIISKGTSAIQRRDELADDVLVTLSDKTSADSDAATFETNQLVIKSLESRTSDLTNRDGEVLRIKEITVTLRYVGA